MNHATDGLLQAYADGEIEGAAVAELLDHLGRCDRCVSELEELRRLGGQLHDRLLLLDVPAPMLRARAALAAERSAAAAPASLRPTPAAGRFHGWSLARAAMLLLALGGVVAAAIPGSPLRPFIERSMARLLDRTPSTAIEPVIETAPARTELGVAPADGRVRLLLHAPARVDVTVTLTDSVRLWVVTVGGHTDELRHRIGTGSMEVFGLADAELLISVPRGVTHATIEIDGRVYVYKQDGALNLSGPAGETRGNEVSFRIER